jgi:adenylate cyclase
MGRVVLRGRRRPVDVFEAAPDFPDADRRALIEALDLLNNDKAAAIERLKELANRNPADIAVKNLLGRSSQLNEEGAYVLA